jgi:hypothetical protein
MATGSTIQSRINYGLGKVGQILGFQYSWYRPDPAGPVVQPSNLMGNVLAHITPTPALIPSPSQFGKPDRYGAFDATQYQAGDYLIGPETYFIGEYMPLSGVSHLIVCNETFQLSRRGEKVPGEDYVGGGLQGNTVLATGFPGWMKAGDRKQPSDLHLPGEVQMPTINILLPVSLSEEVLRGDELITSDTVQSRWTVQSADLSTMGWSIIAVESGAVSPANVAAS